MAQVSNTLHIETAFSSLHRGWGNGAGVVQVFSGALAKTLSSDFSALSVGQNVASFRLDLSQIHFRGMDDVFCVCVGGAAASSIDYVRAAMQKHLTPGRMMLVFVLNEQHLDAIRLLSADRRCVVIDAIQLRLILESAQSLSLLTDDIRRSMPGDALIPYDILQSATGNMFFGRSVEFRRLRAEDMTSFAVTGPSRAGKTSLVKHYLRSLKVEGSTRSNASFYVDLMECAQTNADGYVNFIAHQIGLRRPERIVAANFLNYLRGHIEELGWAVNLILDEADDLCLDDATSTIIATAARHGLIRLVLCGKGDVFRAMLDTESHFASRLKMLKIGPLEEEPARQLLVRPLTDMGIHFDNAGIVERILHLTGRLPHLVQFYAGRLAERLLDTGKHEITWDCLEALRHDHELSSYITSPIEDLRDPLSKRLALILLRDNRSFWNPREARELLGDATVDRVRDLCNELVISNILTWHDDGYRLATQALRIYTRQSGYLDLAFDELQKKRGHNGCV